MLPAMPADGKLQPLFLLNDEAIAAFGEDGLGMNEHAQVIAEAVLGTQSPFTVGIFGPWGHGKTSLLNAARTMLEQPKQAAKDGGPPGLAHPHVITVHFNAWRYEREQHPIVPLLATIAQAVDARLKAPAPAGVGFTEPAKAVLRTIVKGCNTAGRVIGALTRRLTLSAEVPGTGVKVETNVGDAVDAAKKAAAAPSTPAGDIADSWIEHSLYFSAFDDLARLHAAARADAANATHQAPVVAVFIDDLDRCRPENAVAVLEGIKLVLSQPGFVFVLALYREVIERYLEKESEKRFDREHTRLGHGYIDKIVQLPLTLRSHASELEKFIEALIERRLKPGLLPAKVDPTNPEHAALVKLIEAIRGVKGLLAYTSEHSPRKLVRRINELLLDDRLCPEDAASTLACKPEAVRAKFLPLCLIQRSLMELPAPHRMAPMVEDQDLCKALADYEPELTGKNDADGLSAAALFIEALKARPEKLERTTRDGLGQLVQMATAGLIGPLATVDATKARRWLRKMDFVAAQPRAGELLSTEAGRAWLRSKDGRTLVRDFIANRPAAIVAAETAAAESEALLAEQVAIVRREVRRSLRLRPGAAVTRAEMARTKELDLRGDPITDAGAVWMAGADSGLDALTDLNLAGTQVTDAGVVAIASPGSSLKALTQLSLYGTRVTDAGAAALAAKDSGLKSLRKLTLSATDITDAGRAAIAKARPNISVAP